MLQLRYRRVALISILSIIVLLNLSGCGYATPTPAPTATIIPAATVAGGTITAITTAASTIASTATTTSKSDTITPVPGTPTNVPVLKAGILIAVFPALSALSSAKSLQIYDEWVGLAPYRATYYPLQQNGSQFKGQATFKYGSSTVNQEVAIPPDTVHDFLQMLTQVPIEEGEYKFTLDHTDDYPSMEFQIETSAGQIRFFSNSQAKNRAPWAILFARRLYISNSDIPTLALAKLEPYLHQEVQKKLFDDYQATSQVSPTPTKAATANTAATTATSNKSGMLNLKYTTTAQHSDNSFPLGLTVIVSPNSKFFATGGYSYSEIKLWEIATGKELKAIPVNFETFGAFAFSPDGKIFAGDNIDDRSILLWEVATGKQLATLKLPYAKDPKDPLHNSVNKLVFSPDGKILVSGHDNGLVKLWDTTSGQELGILEFPTTHFVSSLAFSSDGKTLLGSDGVIRIWDIATDRELRRFNGIVDYYNGAVFSPDNKSVLSTDFYNSIKTWDVATSKEISVLNDPTGDRCQPTFSPAGKVFATGCKKALKLWGLTTRNELFSTTSPQMTDDNFTLTFSPDGKFLVSSYKNGSAQVWELTN